MHTLSAISFFPSDKFFYIFKKLKRIRCTIFLCNKKNIGHHACLREKEHLFRYRACFEGNLLRFVRARTHVCAQMTQIACAVGMRNAILRNHLKVKAQHFQTFLKSNLVEEEVRKTGNE